MSISPFFLLHRMPWRSRTSTIPGPRLLTRLSGSISICLVSLSFFPIPYYTIPYHIISYHTISYHIIPYHIISHHTISSPSNHTIPIGFMQKNVNALDILIEDAKITLQGWGSPGPSFMLCNSKLTMQLTMTPEKTNFITQGKLYSANPQLNGLDGLMNPDFFVFHHPRL